MLDLLIIILPYEPHYMTVIIKITIVLYLGSLLTFWQTIVTVEEMLLIFFVCEN